MRILTRLCINPYSYVKFDLIYNDNNNFMFTFGSFIEDLFIELNNLRTSPHEFASRLAKESYFYKSNLRIRKNSVPVKTREGLSGLTEAVDCLRSLSPVSAICVSEGLQRAAQFHCNDLSQTGSIDHIGSNDSTLQTRLGMFGKWSECIGETLEFGSVSAFESLAELIIDDGVPSRPHRNMLLNPRFKKVGFGIAPHPRYEICVCIVLAGGFTELDSMMNVEFRDLRMEEDLDLGTWVSDAVRMTCEVKTEEEAGRTSRRVTRFWELNDGSLRTTENMFRVS